jgi:2-polyprenyl-3-methyl-5-hydroxy-6-metoxy-1,4-benzoquinol methylase/uncharacterized protein YbaR (Trm112 family)
LNKEQLDLLVCPVCNSRLEMKGNSPTDSTSSCLVCRANKHTYPLRNGIPRFVDSGNYAQSFGFQWKKFSRVQLDSYNGTGFSEERFRLITGWTPSDLAGKLVLDAGCGAGRFSEVALKYGARLVAFDLSEAVDASQANLAPAEPLICQASIYELPFVPGTFDYVYCIGVVQHTPDPVASVRALGRMVKPGGQIGLWIYERDWKSFVGTVGFKYLLRPIFLRLPRSKQYSICASLVNLFYPILAFCKPRGLLGKTIMRLLPVASAHLQSVTLSPEDFKTWVLLDTFDMYSPAYDQPQTYSKIARLLGQENFENIQRHPHGGIAVTATRRM